MERRANVAAYRKCFRRNVKVMVDKAGKCAGGNLRSKNWQRDVARVGGANGGGRESRDTVVEADSCSYMDSCYFFNLLGTAVSE